jgi:sugar lactone lactonase YvrE
VLPKILAALSVVLLCVPLPGCDSSTAAVPDAPQIPTNVTFATRITTPLAIEGLSGDRVGNLYTPGRNPGVGVPCPVWRVALARPALVVVGFVPAPSASEQCSPSGLTFNTAGDLFISDGDKVYILTPNDLNPQVARVFAAGVPGTNGLAFDRRGDLWTGDGTTGQGRVWKITPAGAVTEMFRVQPMANEVNLASGAGGVGRDVRSLPPGTITVTPTSRNATNTAGSQPLVANGFAFNAAGDMFIADSARGALWKVEFDAAGNVLSRTGCDTTFAANTLCLDNVFVQHPILDGADGIALDRSGNVWVDANERNAIAMVSPLGKVTEVFRNPPNANRLRNEGPLETPTSPFLLGDTLCTANSDGNRRDNSPSTAGEIGGANQPKAKISCMNQPLLVPGLPLPVSSS